MEKTAYFLLIIVAIILIIAWIVGMFQNMWVGIIGLVMFVGFSLLFIKALGDQIKRNKNDKYSRNVEK